MLPRRPVTRARTLGAYRSLDHLGDILRTSRHRAHYAFVRAGDSLCHALVVDLVGGVFTSRRAETSKSGFVERRFDRSGLDDRYGYAKGPRPVTRVQRRRTTSSTPADAAKASTSRANPDTSPRVTL